MAKNDNIVLIVLNNGNGNIVVNGEKLIPGNSVGRVSVTKKVAGQITEVSNNMGENPDVNSLIRIVDKRVAGDKPVKNLIVSFNDPDAGKIIRDKLGVDVVTWELLEGKNKALEGKNKALEGKNKALEGKNKTNDSEPDDSNNNNKQTAGGKQPAK